MEGLSDTSTDINGLHQVYRGYVTAYADWVGVMIAGLV